MIPVPRHARRKGSITPPGHVRVLHVDDDPAVLDLTAEFLERLDDRVAVRCETDPLAVPERLESESVDCLVSDVRMPECDGFELCRRVREDHPDLPVVLFTSELGADMVDRAERVGAADYVVKSPGIEQYEALVDRIRDVSRGCRAGEGESESETRSGTESTA